MNLIRSVKPVKIKQFQADYDNPFSRFKGGGGDMPAPPPPATVPDDISIEDERKAAREAAKRKKGRKQTILTEGVLAPADTERKTLLGG